MKPKPAIWIIDDDKAVSEVVERAFEKEHLACQLQVFSDVPEFLSKIQQASLPPTLLLVDYYLSDTNGLEIIEQLRENPSTRSLKAVLYSQQMNPDILRKAEKLGVYQVSPKPFNFQDWRNFAKELCLAGHFL
jgi:DNA-binding NtrC family response regulator